MTPSAGSLGARETCKLTATFQPWVAKVYRGLAVCNFGGSGEQKNSRSMKLEGIGKYPHVIVKLSTNNRVKKSPDPMLDVNWGQDEEEMGVGSGNSSGGGGGGRRELVVDFCSVAIGSVAERWIEILNVSPVSVHVWPVQSINNIPYCILVSVYLSANLCVPA